MCVPEFAQINNFYIFWFLALICAFSIGFSKNGIVGGGILVVPLMAHIFPSRESTGILLPMLIFGDLIAFWNFRLCADWLVVLRALPGALVGIVVGWMLMKAPWIDEVFFGRIIGMIVLLMLFVGEILKFGWFNCFCIRSSYGNIFLFLVAFIGGTATMMANAAGPIFAIYFMLLGMEKEEFVGSNAIMFLILNLVKVPFSVQLGLIRADSLSFDLFMLPVIIAGAYVGIRVVRYISQEWFNRLVKFLALLAAIKLCV